MVVNLLFNTTPVVIHAQGSHAYKPYWQPIKEKFFASPRRGLGPVPDLTILTWNNGHEAMGILERSLDHLGVPCVVLGRGVRDWVNSRDKPRLTAAALDSVETKYVMGVDSRDAIVLGDPREIVARFERRFSCEMLYSADRLNWPNLDEFKRFEESVPEAAVSDFRFLNGGMWIGRTPFCREFFAAALERQPVSSAPDSEQGILKQLFPVYYPRVQLDYRCQLFQNLGLVHRKILEIDGSHSSPEPAEGRGELSLSGRP
jgi:hypothetical protein